MGRSAYSIRTDAITGFRILQGRLLLQAADLFAYELCHEFENRMERPRDKMMTVFMDFQV